MHRCLQIATGLLREGPCATHLVNEDPGPILGIARGIPATLSVMTTSPPALPHPLTGMTRIPPHQNRSLLSVRESETRMDYYDPGGPLIWESDEQDAVDGATLALTELPQIPQVTAVAAFTSTSPPSPTMDTLRAPHNQPEQLLAERAVEGRAKEGPRHPGPLLWDLESPSASSLPAARPLSVNG